MESVQGDFFTTFMSTEKIRCDTPSSSEESSAERHLTVPESAEPNRLMRSSPQQPCRTTYCG